MRRGRNTLDPVRLMRLFLKAVHTAKNLVQLDIREVWICSYIGFLAGDDLHRISSLTHLRLGNLGEAPTMEGLSHPPTLRMLHLCGAVHEKVSFKDILSFTASQQLPLLNTLVIEELTFTDNGTDTESFPDCNRPIIPSVRTLGIVNAELDFTASMLAHTFPNLKHLVVVDGWLEDLINSVNGDTCKGRSPGRSSPSSIRRRISTCRGRPFVVGMRGMFCRSMEGYLWLRFCWRKTLWN
ncbi:hypothetical protein C8Q80DRAFT_4866 [Daedaleopsis nitida]|nr:hypothetical protein C8Q80DRAFT_4866 [Daedaleopsis nitida]